MHLQSHCITSSQKVFVIYVRKVLRTTSMVPSNARIELDPWKNWLRSCWNGRSQMRHWECRRFMQMATTPWWKNAI